MDKFLLIFYVNLNFKKKGGGAQTFLQGFFLSYLPVNKFVEHWKPLYHGTRVGGLSTGHVKIGGLLKFWTLLGVYRNRHYCDMEYTCLKLDYKVFTKL